MENPENDPRKPGYSPTQEDRDQWEAIVRRFRTWCRTADRQHLLRLAENRDAFDTPPPKPPT